MLGFAVDISMYLKETICILILIPLEFVLNGPMKKDSSGLSNGLAPDRWQAISWTNNDPVHWCLYASPGLKLKLG